MSQTVYAKDIQLRSTGTIYIGNKDTDGTYKMVRSGNDWLVYKRESGSWVEKGGFTA